MDTCDSEEEASSTRRVTATEALSRNSIPQNLDSINQLSETLSSSNENTTSEIIQKQTEIPAPEILVHQSSLEISSNESGQLWLWKELDDIRAEKEALEKEIKALKAKMAENVNASLPNREVRRGKSSNAVLSINAENSTKPVTRYYSSLERDPFPTVGLSTSHVIVTGIRSTPLIMSTNPSKITSISNVVSSISTPILSLYARPTHTNNLQSDVENNNYHTSSSSHSIFFHLQPIPHASKSRDSEVSVNNLNGVEENEESQEVNRTEQEIDKSSCCIRSRSLPIDGIMRTPLSPCDVNSSTELRTVRRLVTQSAMVKIIDFYYWQPPTFPRFIHLRHSTTCTHQQKPWIYNVHYLRNIEALSATSSIYTSNTSTATNVTTSSEYGPLSDDDELDLHLQPIPSLALDYVSQNGAAPEHPFPQPTGEGRTPALHAVMAYINTRPVAEASNQAWPALHPALLQTPSTFRAQQIHLTAATSIITLIPNDRDQSFMSRLRSDLFYNLQLLSSISDMTLNTPSDFATDASSQDGRSQTSSMIWSSPDLSNVEREDIDEIYGDVDYEDETENPLSSTSSSSGYSSSVSQPGQDHDFRIVYTDEFPTSPTPSEFPVYSGTDITQTRTMRPWNPPSVATMGGGKYDFLRVVQRPRAFTGHKFVMSVFGATARRDGEARLPWIPTYADRLLCILNQYLYEHGPIKEMSTQSTQTGKQSSETISLVPVESSEVSPRLYPNLEKSSTKFLMKSCLKSRDGLKTESSVSKGLSWSWAVHVDEEEPLTSDIDINSNTLSSVQDSILKTRSCPGILVSGEYATEENFSKIDTFNFKFAEEAIPEPSTTCAVPCSTQVVLPDIPGVIIPTKKRRMTSMFMRLCCCNTFDSDTDIIVDQNY